MKRKERRSQWASRYNERLPASTLRDQPLAEGQEGGSSIDLASENGDGRQQPNGSGEFWSRSEERYYGANAENGDAGSGRWHYPANFEDAEPVNGRKKSKRSKKDRWARTEDAYSITDGEAPTRRKKSKRKSRHAATVDDEFASRDSSTNGFPEDPEGGLYGPTRGATVPESYDSRGGGHVNEQDILNQEV